MNQVLKNLLLLLLALALSLLALFLHGVGKSLDTDFVNKDKPGDVVACTLDARICPDGSAVGREGPNCEFAKCPREVVGETGGSGGTSGGSEGILPYDSGIRGQVTLGPVCPVMQDPPDQECADRPYVTKVNVYSMASSNSAPYAIVETDGSGHFVINVPPGMYELEPVGGKPFPSCGRTPNVIVDAGKETIINLSCDTGIR